MFQIDCFPATVPADTTSTITILPHFPDTESVPSFRVRYVAANGLLADGHLPGARMNNGTVSPYPPYSELQDVSYDPASGRLQVRNEFKGEGEHALVVEVRYAGTREFKPWKTYGVYALKSDLLALRPFRGDLHMHSSYSKCNGDREPPASFGVENRRKGCDFICVSDHKQFDPSLEAQAFFEGIPTIFRAYPGEEVHLSDYHNLHFGLFGGTHGISSSLVRGNESFETEIRRRLETLSSGETDPELRHLMAASDLVIDAIHRAGGIAVLNHPYWRPLDRFFLPEPVLQYILKQGKFDAMEIAGQSRARPLARETNLLAVALWQQESIRRGKMIPPVGSTDAHRLSFLGLNCTYVFAEKNSLRELMNAIRTGNCLASERAEGEFPHIYGEQRLVQYAYFLLRNYYPEHDRLCREEADYLNIYRTSNGAAGAGNIRKCADEQQTFDRTFFYAV